MYVDGKKLGTLEMMYMQQGDKLQTAFNEDLTALVNVLFLDSEGNKHRNVEEQIARLLIAHKMIRNPDYQDELEAMVTSQSLSEDDFFRRISEGGIFKVFLKGVESMIEHKIFDLFGADDPESFLGLSS